MTEYFWCISKFVVLKSMQSRKKCMKLQKLFFGIFLSKWMRVFVMYFANIFFVLLNWNLFRVAGAFSPMHTLEMLSYFPSFFFLFFSHFNFIEKYFLPLLLPVSVEFYVHFFVVDWRACHQMTIYTLQLWK